MARKAAVSGLIGAAAAILVLWTTPVVTGPPLRWLAKVETPTVRQVGCVLDNAIGPNAKLWVAPILVIERVVPGFQEANHRSGGVLAPLVLYLGWALAGVVCGVLISVFATLRSAHRSDGLQGDSG